ncbi:MAG: hypothetical protein GY798_08970 [Hyphomicrobiales bacterium]|nr:hypothetical protein [Hyphomicrobiales bacterium]
MAAQILAPGANVLWTGNPIVAEAPALPWLLDGHLVETLATLTAVRDRFGADTRVVPGHGPVTTMDTVKWNIDYLAAVQDAVDGGLSLEDTVTQVALPEFQGYALWGWVHPGLNVPAAHNDLRG